MPTQDAAVYSQAAIARKAGVAPGSMAYALRLITQGRTDLPQSAAKIKAVLDELNLGPDLRPKAPDSRKNDADAPPPPDAYIQTDAPAPAEEENGYDVELTVRRGAATAPVIEEVPLPAGSF